MLCLLNTNNDIYFNLALEEYLLRQKQDDFSIVWSSGRSVVVGKHQNTMAEINYAWLRENSIPVARRLTGGGTVYHGPGNLNFTFIRNSEPGRLVDFKSFVYPVISYLETLGLKAEAGRRHDILLNGLKISGNAEHVYRNRTLHHGTLLFDADLDELSMSLHTMQGRYKDRAVQSVRSQVTNIRDHLSEPMSFLLFKRGLYDFLVRNYRNTRSYSLTTDEEEQVKELKVAKYATHEWIFGYSPAFELNTEFFFMKEQYGIHLEVVKGVIQACRIRSDSGTYGESIGEALNGKEYNYESVSLALSEIDDLPDSLISVLLEAIF